VSQLCICTLGLSARQAREKKYDSIKADMTYLDKTWGM
jgi:hypothetical protein